MALDGIVLAHIKKEIEDKSLNSRVEKIYQPSKDEIVISLRNKTGVAKLLLSARANSPRIHFISHSIENPQTPPMFCMLLRKKLSSAKLTNIRQIKLERVLFLDFLSRNEIGDMQNISLVTEIMGKYSNIILVDENNNVIDALKRVNNEMSSKRVVLPGSKYALPPAQDKVFILDTPVKTMSDEIVSGQKDKLLNKVILSYIQGVSPIVCEEIAFNVMHENFNSNCEMSELHVKKLKSELTSLQNTVKNLSGTPNMVLNNSSVPVDVTFFTPRHFGESASIKKFETFSDMIDDFYFEKDSHERMKAKSHDLLKKITNIYDRLQRKIESQKNELVECSKREKFRVFADVINANLYSIRKGADSVELPNFYDENLSTIKIKLDESLSPAKNAQRYYKKYQKLKVAEKVLSEEISKAEKECAYLETVIDELNRITSELELDEIKEELINQGYVKKLNKNKIKKVKSISPIEELSCEGFKILVGRNNKQNDYLTLKIASKNDFWFHVKDTPGSHVVVRCNGQDLNPQTINQAASLAAKHSKARYSSNVPVDYTEVRNVSKPNGSKPGMVIYVKYKTVYVTP